MLMRTDPFRDLDRLTQQLLGTNARPSAMLMDAWRDGDRFVVEFDLPGVSPDSVDLDVERNVLTVTAQRPPLDEKAEYLAAERPRGVFSRQLVLGDNLDLDRIEAAYRDGVLRLHIPVAEKAKPRKITINRDAANGDQAITTGHNGNGQQRHRQHHRRRNRERLTNIRHPQPAMLVIPAPFNRHAASLSVTGPVSFLQPVLHRHRRTSPGITARHGDPGALSLVVVSLVVVAKRLALWRRSRARMMLSLVLAASVRVLHRRGPARTSTADRLRRAAGRPRVRGRPG